MKDFSLKFIDIMIGIVLGLGFQWWTSLHLSWQFIAFFFVYIDIIDYWIDYAPSLKKFPPKREADLLIDVAIMFCLFLYIYSTQLHLYNFLIAFCAFKFFDLIWLLRAEKDHEPTEADKKYTRTWILCDTIEVICGGILAVIGFVFPAFSPLFLLTVFIVMRVIIRFSASLNYKKVYFK